MDINVKNNLVYSSYSAEMVLDVPNEKKAYKVKADSIHEVNGKEIEMTFSIDSKDTLFTIDEINKLKIQMQDYIRSEFAIFGKTFKTGDEFTLTANPSNLGNLSDPRIQDDRPNIVKGMGVYRNKKVIVTEGTHETSIHDSGQIAESRRKSYNLYDAETFIQLFGEGVIYSSLFVPEIGTINIVSDMRTETYDVQVTNVIDSLGLPDKGIDKQSAKSSWSEASDKIRTLGELFQKGLISKEEYEVKKNELLKTF
jgi:hypothetical protein